VKSSYQGSAPEISLFRRDNSVRDKGMNAIRRTCGPDRQYQDGKHRQSGPVRFRKHRRPCGQPAAVGGSGRFLPLPAQMGHLDRINATPSDLPFKSTGFATYPVPPQFGQSSGLKPLPPHC
jgi:hypothetical protein